MFTKIIALKPWNYLSDVIIKKQMMEARNVLMRTMFPDATLTTAQKDTAIDYKAIERVIVKKLSSNFTRQALEISFAYVIYKSFSKTELTEFLTRLQTHIPVSTTNNKMFMDFSKDLISAIKLNQIHNLSYISGSGTVKHPYQVLWLTTHESQDMLNAIRNFLLGSGQQDVFIKSQHDYLPVYQLGQDGSIQLNYTDGRIVKFFNAGPLDKAIPMKDLVELFFFRITSGDGSKQNPYVATDSDWVTDATKHPLMQQMADHLDRNVYYKNNPAGRVYTVTPKNNTAG